MFTTHVQEQVQPQTPSQGEIPQVVLAGCQFKLLGLTELDLPGTGTLVLGLGLVTGEVDILENT